MSDYPNETAIWIAARLGKATASRMADICCTRKDGKPLAGRKKYMIELLAERFTGMRLETYMSAAMLFGRETEPQAQAAYLRKTDQMGFKPNFIDHPTIPMTGCSCDLLVDDDGLAEFKSPETHTHLGYFIERVVPEDYLYQIHWQLDCTGRKWADFVSFDPRLPERLQMVVNRVNREPSIIKSMRENVTAFLHEMEVITETLMGERHLESQSVGDDVYSGIEFKRTVK